MTKNIPEGDQLFTGLTKISYDPVEELPLDSVAPMAESLSTADYFSTIEVVPGKKINGQQTLGENIGDNGGINIAYRALQNVLKQKPAGKVEGFTPEQRFFLSWARVWAGNFRPEYVEYLITVDTHSPAKARVNAALPHIDAWYDAFGIKKSDKLFVPKKKRAQIW